jgi:cyclopropane fatty-acyl-phospholipid synthase-like methyltransferase
VERGRRILLKTSYDETASFYDLFAESDDIQFFVEQAAEAGHQCLELGVGTGRVAVELAKRGHRVVGIDISAGMLAVARDKIAREANHVDGRISVIRTDMRCFALRRRFDLLYSPGGGFQECLTKDDMDRCLERVRCHMKPKARLVLAIWLPSLDRKYGVRDFEEHEVTRDGRTVIRSIVWQEAREGMLPTIEIFHQVFTGERLKEEHRVSTVVNILDPKQLRRTLSDGGFEMLEEFGDFEMKPYEPGDEWMVTVARARL